MLIKTTYAKKLQAFIKKINEKPVSDQEKAIQVFCQKQEDLLYEAIKNIQITIPVGSIQVVGPTGAMTNPLPIVINMKTCIIL